MQQYIPWLISAGSLLIAYLSFRRTGEKDKQAEMTEESHQMAGIKEALLKANMKLDQVCSTTNETRADIKSMNKDMVAMDSRLTVLERDMKTAFKYIEDIKGRN